jgi:hypothetical protein
VKKSGETLPAVAVFECQEFLVGDFVRVNERCKYFGDWRDVEMQIVGVRWDRQREKADYTVLHDGDQITDGWRFGDFTLVNRPKVPGTLAYESSRSQSTLKGLEELLSQRLDSHHRNIERGSERARMKFKVRLNELGEILGLIRRYFKEKPNATQD